MDVTNHEKDFRQFVRLGERGRAIIEFTLDARLVRALEGDTLLTAVLTNGASVRQSEFGDGQRAGFCLMGACQDCWMWTTDGARVRACTTVVGEGMSVITQPGEHSWPTPA